MLLSAKAKAMFSECLRSTRSNCETAGERKDEKEGPGRCRCTLGAVGVSLFWQCFPCLKHGDVSFQGEDAQLYTDSKSARASDFLVRFSPCAPAVS